MRVNIRRGCFAWTEEVLVRFRELHAEGKSFSTIGAELGCSRNAAIGKAHRLGFESRESSSIKRTNTSEPSRRKPRSEPKPQLLFPIRKPPPPVVLSKHEPQPLNLTIWDLTNRTCRWAHGNEAPYLFCGHPTYGAPPWCPYHARMSQAGGPAELGRKPLPVVAPLVRGPNFAFPGKRVAA